MEKLRILILPTIGRRMKILPKKARECLNLLKLKHHSEQKFLRYRE